MKPLLNIGTRRELFVDDTLIEQLTDAELCVSHPERREVVFSRSEPWEDNAMFGYSLVTIENVTRLYYRASSPGGKDNVCVIAMAESTDGGYSFQRPDLGIEEFQGSKHNNILWQGEDVLVPPVFLDTNPDCPPDARFKGLTLLGWEKIGATCSGDGFHWRPLGPKNINMDGTFDSVNTSFWDSHAGCYRSYTRMFADPATGQPYPKDGIHWGNAVRAIQTSTSTDFINWSPVEPLQYQDGDLEMQMYTNSITPCPGAEHIYLGFPNRFNQIRENVQGAYGDGCNDALFMCSRDGVKWTRTREAWVRPGLDQRNWTHRNNYPVWGIVQSSDTEWSMLISEHYMQEDGAPGQLRRLAIRPWGFASIAAKYKGGEALTQPLRFDGAALHLNYSTSAAGSIKVEIQDIDGKPLAGFSAADMPPLMGDHIDAKVAWNQGADLSALIGKPVRFRFLLKDANIFALQTK